MWTLSDMTMVPKKRHHQEFDWCCLIENANQLMEGKDIPREAGSFSNSQSPSSATVYGTNSDICTSSRCPEIVSMDNLGLRRSMLVMRSILIASLLHKLLEERCEWSGKHEKPTRLIPTNYLSKNNNELPREIRSGEEATISCDCMPKHDLLDITLRRSSTRDHIRG